MEREDILKRNDKAVLAFAVLALSGTTASRATVIVLGPSDGSAPTLGTTMPAYYVRPGGPLDLNVWAAASGTPTAYLIGLSVSLAESASTSIVQGTTPPSGTDFYTATGETFGYPAEYFAGQSPGTLNPTSGATGSSTGSVIVSSARQLVGAGPAAMFGYGGRFQKFVTISGTVASSPGTYYVYGGIGALVGIAEFDHATGQTLATDVTFGYTGGSVLRSGGTGRVADGTYAPTPMAKVVITDKAVLTVTPPPPGTPTHISGSGTSYAPTALGTDRSFAFDGTYDAARAHTLVGFDLSGGTSYADLFGANLPAGALQVTDPAQLATDLAAFNQLGGSYDVVIDLGALPSGTIDLALLPAGVTLNSVAVVPEPASLSCLGLGMVSLGRRRRSARTASNG